MAGAATATDCPDSEHDDVLWLCPRSEVRQVKHHSDVRSQAARMTTSLGVGALLAVASVGTAIAPSTPAHASIDVSADAVRLQALREGPSAALAREVGAARQDRDDAVLFARLGPVSPANEAPLGMDEAPRSDEGAASQAADPEEILQFGGVKVRRHLVETILRAAEATGADPVYMMALADKESSFQPDARARTSTAEGLFQFLNNTWLEMIRDHGAAHGLAEEAAAVVRVGGELTIEDEELRGRVLGLRRDPWVSALMAGELLKRDRKRIERRIGRNLTRNELYLAHFFGAGAAGKFISLRDGKPKQKAAGAFPQAARANKTLFYAQEGKRQRGLTVAEVHQRIDQMIERRANRYAAVTELVAYASAR